MNEQVDDSPYLAEVDFSIFMERVRWPVAAGLIFIADAIDQLGDAIWGSDDPALDEIRRLTNTYEEPPERTGILWSLVKMFEPLLVNGSLTTYIREVGGARTRRLRGHEWDTDSALAAISTGKIGIPGKDGVAREHWVFLSLPEFEVMMTVYGPTGIPREAVLENYQVRHDRLYDLVMSNLAAIASSSSASPATHSGDGTKVVVDPGADPSPDEFEAHFGDARRSLTAAHVKWLQGRLEGWLVARLEDDHLQTRDPEFFRASSERAFEPYWSNDHFRIAWRNAIALHPGRFKVGRPKGRKDGKPREDRSAS